MSGGVAFALVEDAFELECWDESFGIGIEVAHFKGRRLVCSSRR